MCLRVYLLHVCVRACVKKKQRKTHVFECAFAQSVCIFNLDQLEAGVSVNVD